MYADGLYCRQTTCRQATKPQGARVAYRLHRHSVEPTHRNCPVSCLCKMTPPARRSPPRSVMSAVYVSLLHIRNKTRKSTRLLHIVPARSRAGIFYIKLLLQRLHDPRCELFHIFFFCSASRFCSSSDTYARWICRWSRIIWNRIFIHNDAHLLETITRIFS